MTLPNCDYREATHDPLAFVCHHPQVSAEAGVVRAGVCSTCTLAATGIEVQRAMGLGDYVEATIKWLTNGKLRPCGGCGKRRKWLNNLFPEKE